jgi:hypothetical protein
MTAILTIISALLPVVVQALEGFKAINPTVGNLITSIGSAGTVFATEVTANGSSITATTILAAIGAAVTVLQQELTGQPGAAAVLLYVAALDAAIQAGLSATTITSVDATKLAPVTAA